MPTLTLTDLAPGRTATLQLYERGTNTAVGSLITGTSSGTTYSFVGVPATGDYDAQLAGFTTPNGARFPVRNAIAYVGPPPPPTKVVTPSTPCKAVQPVQSSYIDTLKSTSDKIGPKTIETPDVKTTDHDLSVLDRITEKSKSVSPMFHTFGASVVVPVGHRCVIHKDHNCEE
jgi:hypothetical protein